MELLSFALGCLVVSTVVPLILIALFVVRRSILDGCKVTDLDKKYVLITGANGGFGLALARRLDEDGCKVIATCRTQEGANRVKEELSGRAIALQMDVTSETSIRAAEHTVRDLLPTEDALWCIVNNAGVGDSVYPFDLSKLDELRHVMEVNYFGVVMVTKVFLKYLKKSEGRIVNVGSIMGRIGLAMSCGYSPAKAALASLTDIMRRELNFWNISVHLVEPGLFDIGMGEQDFFVSKLQKLLDNIPKDLEDSYKCFLQKVVHSATSATKEGVKDTSSVVNPIVHAVLSTNPKVRYLPGNDHLMLCGMLSSFPSEILDYNLKWKRNGKGS